ncbi:MAG: molybdenum cofactor guanylyltransferase [Anaerolineae bacterium]|nr:molybdenum cofactor guanylyltransferase [Anaerolineae bacterium]
MPTLTVAIIAGGQSSRMGQDKAFVLLDGKPMIAHILAHIASLGQDETILCTNHPDKYAGFSLPAFRDVLPGKGALGGIYSAIYHSQSDYILTVACDMPFLNPTLLHYMIDLRDENGGPYDVIVPVVNDHPQGLHAIYSRACLQPIRARLDADRLKVIGFHDDVRVRHLEPVEYMRFDPEGRSFQNINTPEQLLAAEQQISQDGIRS